MIKAKVLINTLSGIRCENHECKHSPEYHDHILGTNWFIKKGTPCAWITFESLEDKYSSIYCRECIDILFQHFKSVLDTKLWPFQ